MKTFKLFVLALVLGVAAVGCKKVEKIMPKKDGKWSVDQQTTRYYTNNSLDSTETETSSSMEYTFQDDETGTYTDGATSGTFTWTVNDDNDVVTMCENVLSVQVCLAFDVLESSKDKQVWMATIESGTAGNYEEYEISMTRVE